MNTEPSNESSATALLDYESSADERVKNGEASRVEMKDFCGELIKLVEDIYRIIEEKPPAENVSFAYYQERIKVLLELRKRLTKVNEKLRQSDVVEDWDGIVHPGVDDLAAYLDQLTPHKKNVTFFNRLKEAIQSLQKKVKDGMTFVEALPAKIAGKEINKRLVDSNEGIDQAIEEISSDLRQKIEKLLDGGVQLQGKVDASYEEGKELVNLYIELEEKVNQLKTHLSQLRSKIPTEKIDVLGIKKQIDEVFKPKKDKKRVESKNVFAGSNLEDPNLLSTVEGEETNERSNLAKLAQEAVSEADTAIDEARKALAKDYDVSPEEIDAIIIKIAALKQDQEDLLQYLKELVDMIDDAEKALKNMEITSQKALDENPESEESGDENQSKTDDDSSDDAQASSDADDASNSDTATDQEAQPTEAPKMDSPEERLQKTVNLLRTGEWMNLRDQIEAVAEIYPSGLSMSGIAARFGVDDFYQRMSDAQVEEAPKAEKAADQDKGPKTPGETSLNDVPGISGEMAQKIEDNWTAATVDDFLALDDDDHGMVGLTAEEYTAVREAAQSFLATGAEAPKTDEAEPKADDAEPKTDEAEPKADDAEPKTDDAEPKADDAEPKADDAEPKTDDQAKTDDAEPKADDAQDDSGDDEDKKGDQ